MLNEKRRLSASGLLITERKTVNSLGIYMHFKRNVIFTECRCKIERIFYRNSLILNRVPYECGSGRCVNVKLKREAVSFLFRRCLCAAESLDRALMRLRSCRNNRIGKNHTRRLTYSFRGISESLSDLGNIPKDTGRRRKVSTC